MAPAPAANLIGSMHAYLIRHAHAGDRTADRNDIYRPLSARGSAQAGALVEVLADAPLRQLITSPATRCRQTLEPLAEARGKELVEHPGLWEDATPAEALAVVEENLDGGVAICSHGNIIPEVLEILERRGVPIDGRGCAKGSVWILSHNGDTWTGARYVKASTGTTGQSPGSTQPA